MGLKAIKAGAELYRVASEGIHAAAGAARRELDSGRGKKKRRFVADEAELAMPHAVYVFPGAAARRLSGVRRSGIRFLVVHGDAVVAGVELATSGRAKPRFRSLEHGPIVSSFVEGIRAAEKSRLLAKESFEPRLLWIPALSLTALWFHARRSDWLMPLDGTIPGLSPRKLYAPDTALALALAAHKTRR